MGYFSRLDRSSRLRETPPPPVVQRSEPEPVPAQPTAREAAAPAIGGRLKMPSGPKLLSAIVCAFGVDDT